MSWSLQLQNGDFPLSGASFAVVTNESKLVQDFRCAILEPMGTDDAHPGEGSLIDGGVTPDGVVVPSLIGNEDPRHAASAINADIQRLARNYQSQQLTRAKADLVVYGRASLTPGEVLAAINNIEFVAVADALTVTVSLHTGTAAIVDVALPLGTA